MPLIIRSATEAELALLAQMNKKLIEAEGSRNPMSVEELRERMSYWLGGDWKVELFAEQDAIVGYAVYQLRQDEYDSNKQVVYLRQFYIEPDKRNQGLGQFALEVLVREHFPTGSTIVIDVLASNPAGYRFWSKVGFQPYCTTMHLQNLESISA